MFRHSMTEKVLTLVMSDGSRGARDMTTQRGFDMAAVHIITVRDRKIHEIEGTGVTLPFMSPERLERVPAVKPWRQIRESAFRRV